MYKNKMLCIQGLLRQAEKNGLVRAENTITILFLIDRDGNPAVQLWVKEEDVTVGIIEAPYKEERGE